MNLRRLRKRGWSEGEIQHMLGILKHAEETKHPRLRLMEHIGFWVVIVALASGTVAVSLELLPLILLSSFMFTIPILFIIGSCLGLLLIHVLHDLKLEQAHQHAGALVLLFSSVISMTLILSTLQERIGAVHTGSAFFASIIFSTGIMIPYLVHWRTTHESL